MKTRMVYLAGPRELEIVECEIPRLKDNEILVRVISSGLCHSDIPAYLGISTKGVNKLGNRTMAEKFSYPEPIGHEAMGVVVEAGKGVKRFKAGDYCGGAKIGAFCDYLVSGEEFFHPIPKDTRNIKHCLVEPLSCVVNIVKTARPQFGDYVAVIGCGFMGLLILAGLKYKGLRELIAIDLIPERLELAKKMGATTTIQPGENDVEQVIYDLTGNHGVDVVIEITGSLKGLEIACAIVRNADYFGYKGRGRILIPSLYGKPESWNPKLGYDLMFKSPDLISAHPWYSMDVAEDARQGIWAYSEGILPLDSLITHTFKLEDIKEGFEMMANSSKEMLKGIVTFDGL
ncbi:MAG: zinc-dependent alcohol dehydrogenase [Acetivibrionales bacterium]